MRALWVIPVRVLTTIMLLLIVSPGVIASVVQTVWRETE
jgi:hypothetical protein